MSPKLVWRLQSLMLGPPGARGLSLTPGSLSQGISTNMPLLSAKSLDINLDWQTGLLRGKRREGEERGVTLGGSETGSAVTTCTHLLRTALAAQRQTGPGREAAGPPPEEPETGTYVLHLPCAQSASRQTAPQRHPDHQSVGPGAGERQPGRARWGRRPAHCRERETALAPLVPDSLPGHAVVKAHRPRPKRSLQYGQPVLPSGSTLVSAPTRGRMAWGFSPRFHGQGCLGSNPSATTSLAAQGFSFLFSKMGISIIIKAQRRSWHSESAL